MRTNLIILAVVVALIALVWWGDRLRDAQGKVDEYVRSGDYRGTFARIAQGTLEDQERARARHQAQQWEADRKRAPLTDTQALPEELAQAVIDLKAMDKSTRARAVELLRARHDPRTATALFAASGIFPQDPSLCGAGLATMEGLPAADTAALIVSALENMRTPPSGACRVTLEERRSALGAEGPPLAMDLLAWPEPAVVLYALGQLHGLTTAELAAVRRASMEHPAPEVRSAAAAWLAAHPTPSGVP